MFHEMRYRICLSRGDGKPHFLQLRSSTWFITLAVCMAIFTDMFLYAVIVPVFPFSLVDRFHVAKDEVQRWLSVLLATYGAALFVGAPLFGFYADKAENRRIPLLLGLLSITGSTLMICFARSLTVLIMGRILQGFSASVIWVVGLALLADTAGKESVAQVFGYVGAASSLGTVVAPVLGGIVYDNSGYYPVFAMCFGLIAFDICFRLALIEKKVALAWSGKDVDSERLGSINIPSTTGPLFLQATTTEAMHGSSSDRNLTTSMEGQGCASNTNRKKQTPTIVRLWKSPRLLTAFWGDFVTATVMVAFDTTLPLFVSRTFHWTSLNAGLCFLALLLPTFLGPVLGTIVDKYGARWMSALGLMVMVPSLTLLRFVDHDSVNQIILLCALLLLIGAGTAMILAGLYTEFSQVCDAIESSDPGSLKNRGYAQSYGISELAWALAGLLSPFMAGGIYESAGWGTLGWTLGLLCAFTAVPVLLYTGC